MRKDVPRVPASTPLIELGSNTESSKASAGGTGPTDLYSGGFWEKMLSSPDALPERRTTDFSALMAVQAALTMGRHCA